jgi:hypothetical protein
MTTSPLGDTATVGPIGPTATPFRPCARGGYAMWMNLATLGVPSAVMAKSR